MPRLFSIVGCLILSVYAATGIYEIETEETGVEYLFGRIVNSQVPPGIHWNFPAPMGRQVIMPTRLNQIMPIGYDGNQYVGQGASLRESLWFTGGTSVVECRLDIQYSIARLDKFLLSHGDPEEYMRLAAEREVTRFFAGLHVDEILTTKRQALSTQVSTTLQHALDEQELGIKVQDVSIAHLAPPNSGNVSNAFRKVQTARSEREQKIENARSDAARVAFDAQAEAETIKTEAQAERFTRIEQARAKAKRFRALARERAAAPNVTEIRLYRDIVPEALRRAKLYILPDDTQSVSVE